VASAYGAVLAEANPEDVVVVFGSFYTVADVMALDLNKRI
jgi:dihydrofolate synthase/folylpolyglutamate synthase